MKRMVSWIMVIPLVGGASSAWSGEVSVREETMEIPTYLRGPDDRNPPIENHNVYPYPMQTDITGEKAIKPYRVVVLENDFIRVLILPDVGGRLYAALDKTNKDFDFIYWNHVIKPGLVALRGAWLSGGIEWNFPTLGHTVNTVSPVQYKIIKDMDGSVSCVVGCIEWVRRMRWAVVTTLSPDRAYFKNKIVLYNPTLTHNNGYFWANAAVHAWDDTRVIFPPTDYIFSFKRANPRPWPILDGTDRSWYKNTASPFDYFCGTPGDYNGAYNVEHDCGTVHCGVWHESLGKKFWTWGTARGGAMWEGILTDNDGQYIEVQSGRLLTQGDTWILEPHMTESWEEYWYPVKGIKGFVKANPDAAMNLDVRGDKVFVGIAVTRRFEDAHVSVRAGDREIMKKDLAIDPREPFTAEVPVAKPGAVYQAELCERLPDKPLRQIIAASTEKPKASPPPELEPSFEGKEGLSVEEIYLKGYYALKHWSVEQAVFQFKEALTADPGFTPALRWLGIIEYQTGRFTEALERFNRVLARNDDDATARYYRALCKIRLGIRERTEEDLYMVGRRPEYRYVAPYVLASLAIERGDMARAWGLLFAARDQKASLMSSVVEPESMGKTKRTLRDAIGFLTAFDCSLSNLTVFVAGDPRGLLRGDPQNYLEVACDFAEMNLVDRAIDVLNECLTVAPGHPFVHFYLGYFEDKRRIAKEASPHFAKGIECSPDYVFPFRLEDFAVLEAGLRYFPAAWQLHYYRGLLLAAKLRWEEGLFELMEAAKAAPSYSPLYAALGELHAKRLNNRAEAIGYFERAIACAPDDWTLHVRLDQLYAAAGLLEKRSELFAKAPAAVSRNFNVLLRRALYLVEAGRYDEALEILRTNTFHPWEGWTGGREVYLLALHARADRSMAAGKFAEAAADMRAAMEYPENLGTGRPADPDPFIESCTLAFCLKELGDAGGAAAAARPVADRAVSLTSPNIYYKALALRALGKEGDAKALLEKAAEEIQLIAAKGRGNAELYHALGLVRHGLGENGAARAALEKSLALDPENAWPRIMLRATGAAK
jgi:tetratricopeptide (TPR) repeat protein